MKLLISALFLIPFFAQAQDINEVVRLKGNVVPTTIDTLQSIAKDNARHILIAYNEDDPGDLQNVIDNIDSSWFVDMDVFLGDDLPSVIDHIRAMQHAAFMDHKGNVLIDVSETHDLCLVTVYCLPNVKN